MADHDPRYLAGIVLFNRGDFFEAHEVWEALWMERSGEEKKFIQGLIQTAVALCHFCNENTRGALKLYRSSREYMHRYAADYWGLDQAGFWRQMDACFAPLVKDAEPPPRLAPAEDLIPTITLSPPPEDWPDPAAFLDDDHE